ncbi:MAG TPA: hypothetical protein PKI20_01315 [Verrucomicrobiota bacterium]|jgi:hypothetical protein|nr:hypothetical protein [Verrucomicrobiota bacterium]
MEALFHPGACWLVIVDNRCTVLRIQPGGDRCQFPGENGEHSLGRIQEWLSPVWTATMLKCVQCLKRIAQQLKPGAKLDICDQCRNTVGSPRPMSYWLGYLDDQPEIVRVVEDGIHRLGEAQTYPLAHVREWLMPIWGPDMVYCPGCCQAKPRKDIVFLFHRSPKGVCKDCSEHFEFEHPEVSVRA